MTIPQAGVVLKMRMQQRVLRNLSIVAVTAAISSVGAGCGGTSDGDAASVGPLPTTENPEGTGLEAPLGGRLEGDADTGCVWLVSREYEADVPGGRVATVWPRGFTALWDPLRLMRSTGEVAAVEGDVVRTGGGLVPMSPPVPPIPSACWNGDEVWVVSSVEPAG